MRSLLFIPGDDEKKLGKGVASEADALILDLEDSVSAARKEAAREITRQYLVATRALEKRPLLYVRINALDTAGWEGDLTRQQVQIGRMPGFYCHNRTRRSQQLW